MEISIAQFNQNLLIFLVLSIKSDLVNWPMNFIILDYIFLEGEFWYISDDFLSEVGIIRSISEGDVLVPRQGWQYFNPNTDVRCTTVR